MLALLRRLHGVLQVPQAVGFVSVVALDVTHNGDSSPVYAPLDIHFGVPLHDTALNAAVCKLSRHQGWPWDSPSSLQTHMNSMHRLHTRTMRFASQFFVPTAPSAPSPPAAAKLAAEEVPTPVVPPPLPATQATRVSAAQKDLVMAIRAGWSPFPQCAVLFDGHAAVALPG